ncbi:ATP-grasp domain-containing protein [Salarchaeum japonicum]|uniref:RimK family alpha-L-glutamate ligase n=1 Tax=Salarchaeum japonicum TaxID=555573 RepID=A0AAV3T2Y5_9EURY|nr:RimK family alpha-L-glutamate ligase [Salarchaeum japonicum]
MLSLAVATDAETLDRIRGPLADRGISASYVNYRKRTLSLSDPPFSPGDFDVGLVYPGRLMEGGVLDAFLDVPWVNDRNAVLRSRNKAGVLARLETAGVPVPETVFVSNPTDDADVLDALAGFDYPVVVKPNSATRGVGVTKLDDPDSLLGVTDYLDLIHDFPATDDTSYLVQECVPDATDYRVMVLDGEYAGAVERRGSGWKHNVHRGADATGTDPPDRVKTLAEDAADVLDIPLLGVDVLDTGARTVVNETNARPTIDAETKYEPGFYDRLAGLVRATRR